MLFHDILINLNINKNILLTHITIDRNDIREVHFLIFYIKIHIFIFFFFLKRNGMNKIWYLLDIFFWHKNEPIKCEWVKKTIQYNSYRF